MKQKIKEALPKRILALILMVAMAVTLLPVMSMTAKAAYGNKTFGDYTITFDGQVDWSEENKIHIGGELDASLIFGDTAYTYSAGSNNFDHSYSDSIGSVGVAGIPGNAIYICKTNSDVNLEHAGKQGTGQTCQYCGYTLATQYHIWVGGVQVTDANKNDIDGALKAKGGAYSDYINGNISYDPASKTLLLDGAEILHYRSYVDDAPGSYGQLTEGQVLPSGIEIGNGFDDGILTIKYNKTCYIGSTVAKHPAHSLEEEDCTAEFGIKNESECSLKIVPQQSNAYLAISCRNTAISSNNDIEIGSSTIQSGFGVKSYATDGIITKGDIAFNKILNIIENNGEIGTLGITGESAGISTDGNVTFDGCMIGSGESFYEYFGINVRADAAIDCAELTVKNSCIWADAPEERSWTRSLGEKVAIRCKKISVDDTSVFFPGQDDVTDVGLLFESSNKDDFNISSKSKFKCGGDRVAIVSLADLTGKNNFIGNDEQYSDPDDIVVQEDTDLFPITWGAEPTRALGQRYLPYIDSEKTTLANFVTLGEGGGDTSNNPGHIYRPSSSNNNNNTAPGTTVPVSGEGTSNATVSVSGNNATVSISTSAINNAAGNTSQDKTDTITVDLSGLKETVTSTTISKEDASNIAKALNSTSNNKQFVEFKMAEYSVKVDATAMNAVVNAATGSDLRLVVETTAPAASLNSNQQSEIANKEVARTFEAFFVSNGTRIGNFNGGVVQVGVVKFSVPSERDSKYYHIEYLPESGKAERLKTRYVNGNLIFNTTHFSDYAIVYDEKAVNDTGVLAYRLYDKNRGEHIYTISRAERDMLVNAGWIDETTADGKNTFYASPEKTDIYDTAVYRSYNPYKADPTKSAHMYTKDKREYDRNVRDGWEKDAGIVFYVAGSSAGGDNKIVYRAYNPNSPSGEHQWTVSKRELDALVKEGWSDETKGNAWYSPKF